MRSPREVDGKYSRSEMEPWGNSKVYSSRSQPGCTSESPGNPLIKLSMPVTSPLETDLISLVEAWASMYFKILTR